MSIKRMSAVWEQSKQGGNGLLLLLKIADNAKDDGFCWPGIEYLANKCRTSKATVMRQTKKLEADGEIFVHRSRRHGNKYIVKVGLSDEEFEASLRKHFHFLPEETLSCILQLNTSKLQNTASKLQNATSQVAHAATSQVAHVQQEPSCEPSCEPSIITPQETDIVIPELSSKQNAAYVDLFATGLSKEKSLKLVQEEPLAIIAKALDPQYAILERYGPGGVRNAIVERWDLHPYVREAPPNPGRMGQPPSINGGSR